MKKWIGIGAVVIVSVFAGQSMLKGERQPLNPALPSSAPFEVSHQLDGEWLGKRVDVSGDSICTPTSVIGKIVDGKVAIKLKYNNTTLNGWVSKSGELKLFADSQRWGYRFDGHGTATKIEGEWSVTNAPCHGTWFLEKQS